MSQIHFVSPCRLQYYAFSCSLRVWFEDGSDKSGHLEYAGTACYSNLRRGTCRYSALGDTESPSQNATRLKERNQSRRIAQLYYFPRRPPCGNIGMVQYRSLLTTGRKHSLAATSISHRLQSSAAHEQCLFANTRGQGRCKGCSVVWITIARNARAVSRVPKSLKPPRELAPHKDQHHTQVLYRTFLQSTTGKRSIRHRLMCTRKNVQ